MKKVIITGASKGVGMAIKDSLENHAPSFYDVIDYSRSSGKDITNTPHFEPCDILILNAGVWEGPQLFPLYEATKQRALAYAPIIEHIIFILSNAAYADHGNHDYTTVKSGLLHLSRWLQKQYPKLKVSTISPGTINTGFWDKAEIDNRKKGCMEPEVVAELVYSIIKAGENGACVTELIVLPASQGGPEVK